MAYLVSSTKAYLALKGTVQVLPATLFWIGVHVFSKEIQELCHAATQESDSEKLLSIVDQLNKALANDANQPQEAQVDNLTAGTRKSNREDNAR